MVTHVIGPQLIVYFCLHVQSILTIELMICGRWCSRLLGVFVITVSVRPATLSFIPNNLNKNMLSYSIGLYLFYSRKFAQPTKVSRCRSRNFKWVKITSIYLLFQFKSKTFPNLSPPHKEKRRRTMKYSAENFLGALNSQGV